MILFYFFISGLFNSFDLFSKLMIFIWFFIFFPIFLLNIKNFFMPNRFFFMKSFFFSFLNTIFEETFQSKKNIGTLVMFSSLFLFIFILNFFSLTGYIFPITSHIAINLGMGLMIWTSGILIGILKNPKKILSHLVPNNTPMLLISFLIIIESLSNIMRPFVLSIRLTANLFAGHLLMALISSFKLSIFLGFFSIPIQILFLLLEMMVSLIQAYIFSLLAVNYYGEICN